MAPSRSRRRGTFGAFRRPFVTDLVFWVAALVALAFGALVGALVLAMLGVPGSWVGWLPVAVALVVAGWLAFKLLVMGMNMSRALHHPEPADDARASTLEGTGRAAGALAGRGAAALARRTRGTSATPSGSPETPTPPPVPDAPGPDVPTPGPEPEPVATGSEPPRAEPARPVPEPGGQVTVDRAARVIGSMIGRRVGARRRDGG